MKMNKFDFNYQSGITLVESIATLGIFSVAAASIFFGSGQYAHDTRLARATEHMKIFSEAASSYINDNRALMVDQADSTNLILLSVDTLKSSGYLPSGFSKTNGLGQHICAIVMEPTPNRIQTLVVTEGGETLDDVSLSSFSAQIGNAGGAIFNLDPTYIVGSGNSWRIPVSLYDNKTNTLNTKCDGTPGRVRLFPGKPLSMNWSESNINTDQNYLFRTQVPGNPEANRMETNLSIGGNTLSGLQTVTVGASCGAGVNDGEVASSSNGGVVSCVGGKWAGAGIAYWAGAVDNFSLLPACNASAIGQTRRTNDNFGVYVCTGTHWDAGLTTSGQFVLPKNLQLVGSMNAMSSLAVSGPTVINGQTNAYGNLTANGQIHANRGLNIDPGRTISSAGDLQVQADGNLHLKPTNTSGSVTVGAGAGSGHLYGKGNIVAQGSVVSDGRVTAREHLLINKVVTENSACSSTGLVARDVAGLPLSCVSGRWTRQKIKTIYGSLKYNGKVRYDGWSFKILPRMNTSHWCKRIDFTLDKPSFVFASLYGKGRCNLGEDCVVSTHIFDRYRSKFTWLSENLLSEHERVMSYVFVGPGAEIQSTTSYVEYTSGSVSYEICIGSSSASSGPISAPSTNYSFTVIE